jgi:hypothetical protein
MFIAMNEQMPEGPGKDMRKKCNAAAMLTVQPQLTMNRDSPMTPVKTDLQLHAVNCK